MHACQNVWHHHLSAKTIHREGAKCASARPDGCLPRRAVGAGAARSGGGGGGGDGRGGTRKVVVERKNGWTAGGKNNRYATEERKKEEKGKRLLRRGGVGWERGGGLVEATGVAPPGDGKPQNDRTARITANSLKRNDVASLHRRL